MCCVKKLGHLLTPAACLRRPAARFIASTQVSHPAASVRVVFLTTLINVMPHRPDGNPQPVRRVVNFDFFFGKEVICRVTQHHTLMDR